MNLSEEDPLISFQQSTLFRSRTVKRRCFWRGKDGALGWTVAVSIMLINFITIGLGRMSGILYVDFMREYHVNRKFASAPFSLQQSTRNLFGPVAGLLGHKFGLRALTMTGGLIGALSAAACAFALDITWIIIFWGGFYGIGIAFTSTLNQVILDEYFDRYLSSASGLSFSGGSLGAIVFAFALQQTINDYGMEYSFLIMGAMILLVVPLAITLTSPPWAEELESPSIYEDIIEKSYYPISQGRKSNSSSSEDEIKSGAKGSFWPPLKRETDNLKKGDIEKTLFRSKQRPDTTKKVEQPTKRNLVSNLIFARLKTFGEIFNIGKESMDKKSRFNIPRNDIEPDLMSEAESKIEYATKQKLYTEVQDLDDDKTVSVTFINENSRKNGSNDTAVYEEDTPNDAVLSASNNVKNSFKSEKDIHDKNISSEVSLKTYPENLSEGDRGVIADQTVIDLNADQGVKSNTTNINIEQETKYDSSNTDVLAISKKKLGQIEIELDNPEDDKSVEIFTNKKISEYGTNEGENTIDISDFKTSDLDNNDVIIISSDKQDENTINTPDYKVDTSPDSNLKKAIATEEENVETAKETISKVIQESKLKKGDNVYEEEKITDKINIKTTVSVKETIKEVETFAGEILRKSRTPKKEEKDTSEETASNKAKDLSTQNIISITDEIKKLAQISNYNLKQSEKKEKRKKPKDKRRNPRKKNAKKEYQKSEDTKLKTTTVDDVMSSNQKFQIDEKDNCKTNVADDFSKQGVEKLEHSSKADIGEYDESSIQSQTVKSIDDISPESFVVEKYVLQEVKQIDTDLVASLDEKKNLLIPNQSFINVKEDVEKAVIMGKTINEETSEFISDLILKVDNKCQEFVSCPSSTLVKDNLDKVSIAEKIDEKQTPSLPLISSGISNKQDVTEPNVTQDFIQTTVKELQSKMILTEKETTSRLKQSFPVNEDVSSSVTNKTTTFPPSSDILDYGESTTPFSLKEHIFQVNEICDENKVLDITLPPLSLEGTSRDFSYGGSIISSPISAFSERVDAQQTILKDISLKSSSKSDKARKNSPKSEEKSPVNEFGDVLPDISEYKFCADVDSLRKRYEETATTSQIVQFQDASLVRSNSTVDSLLNLQENIDIDFLRENINFVLKILNVHNTYNLDKKSKNYGTLVSKDSVLQEELETLYRFVEKDLYDSIQDRSLSKRTIECEHSCSKCGLIYKAEEKISFDSYTEEFIKSSELYVRLHEIFSNSDNYILSNFEDSNKENIGKVIIEMRKMYEYVNVYNCLKSPPISLPGKNRFPSNNRCSQCCPCLELVLKLYLNPAFLVICLSRAIHLLTFMGVLTIVVDFSIDRGLKESTGRYAVALMSLGDLIGRLCTGWITDSKIISLEKFMLLAMLFIGVISIAFPVVPENSLLAFFCIYSILQGSVFIRHPVLVSKYTKVEERTVGMGFMTLFSGLLGLVLPYYIGHFRDYIGSYNQVFYINGSLCIAIGFLWIFESWLKRFVQ